MNQTAQKGFTLIELLVVIAVLGILASVVLVAINPGERIKEAEDAGKKNDVSQVATAMESYYTNNRGTYPGSVTTLVDGKYLKRDPGATILPTVADSSNHIVYATITAASATCDSGSGTLKYWVYRSATGASRVECLGTGTPAP